MFQNVISYSFITKSFIHVSDRYNCKHLSIQNHRIITGQEEDIWPIMLCWLSTKSSSYSTFCKALANLSLPSIYFITYWRTIWNIPPLCLQWILNSNCRMHKWFSFNHSSFFSLLYLWHRVLGLSIRGYGLLISRTFLIQYPPNQSPFNLFFSVSVTAFPISPWHCNPSSK